MAPVTLSDDLTLQQLDGGKQRRRSVAFVVMSHRAAASLLQGQPGLGPVQSLNLALLVHAEHDGLLRRVEIEADHIGELLQELRISGQLECLDPVRLEVVAPPDVVDGRLAHPLTLRHQPATPLGDPLRFRLQGGVDHGLDLVRPIGRLAAAPGSHVSQARQSLLGEPLSPEDDGLTIDLQFRSNR